MLPPESHLPDDAPPFRGPNWPFILILAAYIAFFTWLLIR